MREGARRVKIAVMSDTHGNVDALRAVLRFLRRRGVEQMFHLGDAFGYLPFHSEVLALLIDNSVICIKGNHDAMVLGELEVRPTSDQMYQVLKIKQTLSHAQVDFVEGWPTQLRFAMNNLKVFMVHGSPDNPLVGYVYPDSNLQPFSGLSADVVFMGNTHHPFVRHQDCKLFINVGSVGLPRDVGNLSSVCIFDGRRQEAEIYRIPFEPERLMTDPNCKDVHEAVWTCMARRRQEFCGTLVL